MCTGAGSASPGSGCIGTPRRPGRCRRGRRPTARSAHVDGRADTNVQASAAGVALAVGVASILKDIIIEADPDEVWDALRDWGALHRRLAPGFVADTRL